MTVMKRQSVDHILRAVNGVSGVSRIGVVGSAAIVLSKSNYPLGALVSNELDVFALGPEMSEAAFSDLVSASIGQDSQFHRQFGYYADGVESTTAKLPAKWLERSIPHEYAGFVVIAPCAEDLAVSKLVAWREKDIAWLKEVFPNLKQNLFADAIAEYLASGAPQIDATEIERRFGWIAGPFADGLAQKLRESLAKTRKPA